MKFKGSMGEVLKQVSGSKIILAKSKPIPIGDVGNVDGLACTLGCRVASLLIKVLGSSFGSFLPGFFYLEWHYLKNRMLFGWLEKALSI